MKTQSFPFLFVYGTVSIPDERIPVPRTLLPTQIFALRNTFLSEYNWSSKAGVCGENSIHVLGLETPKDQPSRSVQGLSSWSHQWNFDKPMTKLNKCIQTELNERQLGIFALSILRAERRLPSFVTICFLGVLFI